MAQKCVHSGCGKEYTDADEVCKYHPGPPVFHEGQKGWKCCKPRVLTFEEFMEIPPCTEGKHSTTDLPPQPEKRGPPAGAGEAPVASATPELGPAMPRIPIATPAASAGATAAGAAAGAAVGTPQAAPEPESDEDDPSLDIPDGRVCRRRGCGATHSKGSARESASERCVHHPGAPIFHEGSKGYSCCKRRVLDFDDFMKIEGCQTKTGHLFVGSGKKSKAAAAMAAGGSGEELLETVRTDFYQSATALTASFFLKKIDKDKASVVFTEKTVELDLPTTDSPPKRYKKEVPLYGSIDAAKSTFKILGTKLEVVLAKSEISSWPVLRSDDRPTGEIFQVGRAGTAGR